MKCKTLFDVVLTFVCVTMEKIAPRIVEKFCKNFDRITPDVYYWTKRQQDYITVLRLKLLTYDSFATVPMSIQVWDGGLDRPPTSDHPATCGINWPHQRKQRWRRTGNMMTSEDGRYSLPLPIQQQLKYICWVLYRFNTLRHTTSVTVTTK